MIQQDFNLSNYNTFRLFCIARFGCSVSSIAMLAEVCRFSLEKSLPFRPLGQGSNVILPEQLDAVVALIQLSGCEVIDNRALVVDMGSVREEEIVLKVAAGCNWHNLVIWTVSQGYYGLENLALIPGTVGAAPVQNIGAYGVELSDYCCAVEILEIASGQIKTMMADECEFGYRNSAFKKHLKGQVIITALYLKLSRVFAPNLEYKPLLCVVKEWEKSQDQAITAPKLSELVIQIRRSKLPDPSEIGNVGSFFKNPIVSAVFAEKLQHRYPKLPTFKLKSGDVKLAAAWLIEQSGLKGYSFHSVAVSKKQALVFVNTGEATQQTVLNLADKVKYEVLERFNVKLSIEPEIIS